MKSLLSYLMLPSTVTEFEQNYLRRLNRIAILFFYAHIPVMMLVAAICGTGPVLAGISTSVLLVGATLAYFQFKNVRHLSLVFGFTAMCLGGLLVHFGQGPMQIEMHFYFFVLIALLAVFANPLVIIVAAVTVALHHQILFIVFPSSVFNYEATNWAVAIHALFVVLESVAACFVARSFFDSVIGLERIVQSRTRDMRLILDTVGQGFVSINRDGSLSLERSVVVDGWLGAHVPGRAIWDILQSIDADVAAWFRLGWDEVWAGVMPLEMTLELEQLPRQLRIGSACYQLDYKPIFGVDGKLTQVLLVMSDVTSLRESEHAQAVQRELMEVFIRITRDRRGFAAFFEEASSLVEHLVAERDGAQEDVWRELHTLKGNAAIFGLTSLVGSCHELEARLLEEHRGLTPVERDSLRASWTASAERMQPFLGEKDSGMLEIFESDQQELLQAIESDTPRAQLAKTVRSWKFEATAQRLDRIARAARGLAQRMSKGEIRVIAESNKLRLLESKWSPVWSSFAHLIRNAVDHGLEAPEERRVAGKSDAGTIRLRTEVVGPRLVMEIADDGRGIQWDRVADHARKAGLNAETRDDLMMALFTTGISTKEVANEYSGRGIGLSVVKRACEALGGEVHVDSTAGKGTCFELSWPLHTMGEEAA